MKNELVIPGPALKAKSAVEVMRLWVAKGELHTSLRIGYWQGRRKPIDETWAWGVVLADTVRHIANAHEQRYGKDPRETIKAVLEAMNSELAKPTAPIDGE